jgi:maleamate amidohydrolase
LPDRDAKVKTLTKTQAASDEEFFRQRGFGLRIGFGKRPALLVIDILKGFTDPTMPLGANLDSQVEAIRSLLAAARQRKLPILFSTVSYDDDDLKDAGIWALKQKGVTTLRAGSAAVELDTRLDRQPAESVIMKKYASCFFGTDLTSRLVAQGIDTLVITGCTTSGCVRASAVDACQNGFRPMVVSEAVGDRSEAAHKQSLFDLNAKYADVVSLAETLAYFQSVTKSDPAGR